MTDMRLLAVILCISLFKPCFAQRLNLTNLQHELRWLDEISFPPFAKDPAISDEMLEYTASALSRKFQTDSFTLPAQVDYKMITMFGKPRLQPPATSSDAGDYQASVLSFITRATTGLDVWWQMRVEVQQKGKTVYSRETKHQLLNYETATRWFDQNTFIEHFTVLIDELFELRPALPAKYVLGNGADHAEVLRSEGYTWKVDKHGVPIGFGKPSFGPYTTLSAGRQDTAVIRTSMYRGKESSVGTDGGRLFFDQFKTYDVSKTKFGSLDLGNGGDTVAARFAILTRGTESRRTFLSDLLSNSDENGASSSGIYQRTVEGSIRTDTLSWSFVTDGYGADGTILGGYLENKNVYFRLFFRQHTGYHWEIITQDEAGRYLASLEVRASGTEIRMLKALDRQTADAIATLYAVLMSAKNVQ